MDNIALFLVLIIILICAVIWMQSMYNNHYEQYGNYCGKCEGRTLGQCRRCSNCGFISKGVMGKCVDGDIYGPSNWKPEYHGARWISNDPFWTHVLVSDNIVAPANHVNGNKFPAYAKEPIYEFDLYQY